MASLLLLLVPQAALTGLWIESRGSLFYHPHPVGVHLRISLVSSQCTSQNIISITTLPQCASQNIISITALHVYMCISTDVPQCTSQNVISITTLPQCRKIANITTSPQCASQNIISITMNIANITTSPQCQNIVIPQWWYEWAVEHYFMFSSISGAIYLSSGHLLEYFSSGVK